MKADSTDKNILTNLGIGVLNEMQVAARNTIMKEKNTVLLSPTEQAKHSRFFYRSYDYWMITQPKYRTTGREP